MQYLVSHIPYMFKRKQDRAPSESTRQRSRVIPTRSQKLKQEKKRRSLSANDLTSSTPKSTSILVFHSYNTQYLSMIFRISTATSPLPLQSTAVAMTASRPEGNLSLRAFQKCFTNNTCDLDAAEQPLPTLKQLLLSHR